MSSLQTEERTLTINDSTYFVVELEVKPGQVDDLKAVARDIVSVARKDEPGTLNYEYFLSQDGTTCHIYERYVNPEAHLRHGLTVSEELNKRGRAFRPVRLTVYGKVTEEVRERLIEPLLKAVPGFRVVYMDPISRLIR